MLKNQVKAYLNAYKFSSFLKKATKYIDNLPVDDLYTISLL